MGGLLTVDRLTKSFFPGVPVLGPVTTRFAAGSLTAIVGRSGCGKSTLLRCLGGLERPTEGGCILPAAAPRRGQVGFVFQEPRLMPWLDVARNAGFGLAHLSPADRAAAVREALEVMQLGSAARLLPKQLSGGMAQRVALARALATRPTLLLLDEPFSALDPFTRARMQDHLQAVRKHYDPTTVMITHDINEAIAVADRVLVLRGPPGRIVADLHVASDLTGSAVKRELTAMLAEEEPRLAPFAQPPDPS